MNEPKKKYIHLRTPLSPPMIIIRYSSSIAISIKFARHVHTSQIELVQLINPFAIANSMLCPSICIMYVYRHKSLTIINSLNYDKLYFCFPCSYTLLTKSKQKKNLIQ